MTPRGQVRVLLSYFSELGSLGGVETAVVDLARGLIRAGCAVNIVEMGERWGRRELPDGIPIWTISSPSKLTISRPRSWVSCLRSVWQFLKIVRSFQPTVVNVHYPVSQFLPVLGAHSLPHAWKLVVTVHNSDIRVAPQEDAFVRTWQARLMKSADAVTAVSLPLLSDASREYPVISGKGHVVLNGVDKSWFQQKHLVHGSHKPFVLFVGRLHEIKGVDILLAAWASLHSRFPLVELWLAGSGPEEDSLIEQAQTLGITRTIQFLGRRSQEELAPLYASAELVVLPSRREGLPFTLLEAGACGAICIGSDTPGIPEIIRDGETGFLADPESPDSLAMKMIQVLEMSTGQRAAMKAAARQRILTHFSKEKEVREYLAVFKWLEGKNDR